MVAEYWAGCSIAAIAAHQPPADTPIVAQAERSVFTRKVRATQSGTSWVSQVSTSGSPGRPFTHSVSTPPGTSDWAETISAERSLPATTCCCIEPARSIPSNQAFGDPG